MKQKEQMNGWTTIDPQDPQSTLSAFFKFMVDVQTATYNNIKSNRL